MRGRLILVGVGLIVAAVGFSWLVVGVQAARQAVRRSQCIGQLKFIGVALLNYQDRYGSFPTGAIPNPGLPPERRLSWIVASWVLADNSSGRHSGGTNVVFVDGSVHFLRDTIGSKVFEALAKIGGGEPRGNAGKDF